MTVAVSVLTVGLAVAALSGIPSFVETRVLGDVMMVLGFAIALVGAFLVLLAVPGQRHENGVLRRNAEIDADQLRIERSRLWSRKADVLAQLADAETTLQAALMADRKDISAPVRAKIKDLQTQSSDLEAALSKNANEFRRFGAAPPAPDF